MYLFLLDNVVKSISVTLIMKYQNIFLGCCPIYYIMHNSTMMQLGNATPKFPFNSWKPFHDSNMFCSSNAGVQIKILDE